MRTLDEEIRDAASLVNNCKAFAAQTGTVQTEADRAALAQAEQAVEDTREVVRLVKAEADATRLHETIVRYTEIARALGPEGVRAKMLEKGLRTLNSGLGVIASAAGLARNGDCRQRRRGPLGIGRWPYAASRSAGGRRRPFS